MNRYVTLLTATAALAFPSLAFGADAGTVTADAKVVLAKTVRALGFSPGSVRISGVTVSGDHAALTWTVGTISQRATMYRLGSRWLLRPAAAAPLAGDALLVRSEGGSISPPAAQMSGYGMSIKYAANDAAADSRFSFFYGRTPTPAEFLPYPTQYPLQGSNAVFYSDVTIAGPKPVRFRSGTAIDVWFPFAIDDRLSYVLFMDGAGKPIGPLVSTPVFDNSVHFVLPAFVATPGVQLRYEIDGSPH